MSKKPESAVGIFFSMMLRAMVVILGITIVVFGAYFVLKVTKDGGKKKNEPATTVNANVLTEVDAADDLLTNEPVVIPDDVPGEPVAAADSRSMNILVLNSTDVKGLAGRWCDTLNANGYNNTKAADYSELQSTTRIVAKLDGAGQDLLSIIPNASYEVGTITSGSGEPTDNYDIVVIIGTDNSEH